MKWLWGRILGRRSRSEATVDEQPDAESKTSDQPRPSLALLVPDAAGPDSYRHHTFDDAASAAAFVQFWFPPGLERGTLAFWAAHQEPVRQADSNDGRSAEVVVLIGDEARRGVFFPFSFSDMALARSWLGREAIKGLSPRSVQVFWALPVRISRDHYGRVRLTPADPPALRRPEGATAPAPADSTRSSVPPEETPSERSAAGRERGSRDPEPTTETNDATDAAPADRAAERRAGADRHGAEVDDVADILREVERLIRERRWRQREEPFRGFDSPPGKF